MNAPHIWVPKAKIVDIEFNAPGNRIEGFFMVEVVNRYGQVKRQLGPWRQLVTNYGMSDYTRLLNASYCAVGTGSPTFTEASTTLASRLSNRTNTLITDTRTAIGAPNYQIRQTKVWAFPLGGLVGNLTEVGIFNDAGPDTGTGVYLDLIRDSGGSPTTFPVTSSDQLRVTHLTDHFQSLDTLSGSFTIGGAAGSGSHDYLASIGRQNGVVNSIRDLTNIFYNMVEASGSQPYHNIIYGAGTFAAPTPTQTETVAGTSAGNPGGTWSASAYATSDNITWTRPVTITYGLGNANNAGGIRAIFTGSGSWWDSSTRSSFFIAFNPVIPKFAGSIQRILTLNLSKSYTRV